MSENIQIGKSVAANYSVSLSHVIMTSMLSCDVGVLHGISPNPNSPNPDAACITAMGVHWVAHVGPNMDCAPSAHAQFPSIIVYGSQMGMLAGFKVIQGHVFWGQ